MKSRLKTMIAVLFATCFLLSGCVINSGSSQDSSANNTGNSASEATEAPKATKATEGTSEKSSSDNESVPTEPLEIETPAGAVLVGKIKKDENGWYFEPEQPLTVKLTCYPDFTPTFENIKRINMFNESEDGTSKELYRNETVTIAGMLQNYRGDMDSLYLYPCKIEYGKMTDVGYSMPELDYPVAEPVDYDPSIPLPDEMQPKVENGYYVYNPYILTENALEGLGNDFAAFYKGFVDAWLSYRTSCPCPNKRYAEMFSNVMYFEFPLFSADGKFDLQNGYDEKTQTLSWGYTSEYKAEHDKLIADFTADANRFLNQVKASDSEQLRAQALYHACLSR